MRHRGSVWAVQAAIGVFAVCTLGQPSAWAQTPCGTDCWQADTCERADVQAAVDAAQAESGGTVRIPASGSAPCEWTAPVLLDASTHPLYVWGMGEGATQIRARATAFDVQGAEGVCWSVSHLGITDGPCAGYCDTLLSVSGGSDCWRIHHLHLETTGEFVRLFRTGGHTSGLIDNILVRGTTPSEFVTVDWDNWSEWKREVSPGTADAVFVEDCDVYFSDQWEGRPFDSELGGRMVVRHNRVQNQILGSHGFDTGYGSSVFSVIAYANEFVIDDDAPWSSASWARFTHFRGGTGILYDNHFTVGDDVWISAPVLDLAIYRTPGDAGGNEHWPPCDGTVYGMCSNIDRQWTIVSGDHPAACATDPDCVDAIGPGTTCRWRVCSESRLELCETTADCPAGETCTAGLDGDGADGYPCFMQPGFATQMQPHPWYEWGNTWSGGSDGSACTAPPCDVNFGEDVSQLAEDRDYYNDVHSGASPPATCVPYEPFWAPLEQTLYRCEEPDVWVPYYSPHPYPHPLRDTLSHGPDGGVGPDPDAGIDPGDSSSGCGCATHTPAPTVALWLLWLVAFFGGRRLRRCRRRPGRGAALVVALLGLGLAAPALAQPLPEGDTGIAAGYPDDVGIGGDPEVVLADDFEAHPEGPLAWGAAPWDNVWGDVVVTRTPANVYSGAQAVELSHTSSPQSIGAWKEFGTNGFDTLFVRYYMKYDAQFPGCHHTGMILFAGAPGVTIESSTGVAPDGSNHFTAALDDIPPYFSWTPADNSAPGFANIYCYHLDQADSYGDIFLPSGLVLPGGRELFGPTFEARPDVILERGRWYSFELMVQANTPGAQDGRIAFWVDGALAGDFPNLRLRSVADLKLNYVMISTWSSESHDHKTLWYDDVVAATSYIGPRLGDSPPTPDAGVPPEAGVDVDAGDPGDGPSDRGCGCATGALPGLGPVMLLLIWGVCRRRRRARRR